MCLKGKIIKAIISIVLSQDKEAYNMIKEAAGYSKGKKGKNLNYYCFFKTALGCRFEPLVYFIFG